VVLSLFWAFDAVNNAAAAEEDEAQSTWLRLSPRQWLVLVAVSTWGNRLTWNWWKRLGYSMTSNVLQGKAAGHEDWRYVLIRKGLTGSEQKGVSILGDVTYWFIGSLLAIHMFPTVMVFLGCIPLYLAVGRPGIAASVNPLGWVDLVAVLVALEAVWLETAGDLQMDAFLA